MRCARCGLAVGALIVAACGGGGDASPVGPESTVAVVATTGESSSDGLEWEPHSEGVDTARLVVPVDATAADGPTFELFVARHRAGDPARRIGTLLVNPGGPGLGGADVAIFADLSFDAELLARFDIVGWDPRGTGSSTPALECVDDADTTFAAPALGSEPRVALGAGCVERSGDLLAHVGTDDGARDIDALRRALGEERVSYLGFSYGSELGARWATMFPTTVRAAVLDGAEDPTADLAALAVARAAATEAAFDTYLARCAADVSCPFHGGGDPAGAFDRLLTTLRATPAASAADRPAVTPHMALVAVVEAMYAEGYWPQLSTALAAAERGDGNGVLGFWDSHLQRQADGTWSNAAEARLAIRCMDRRDRPTAHDVEVTVAAATAAAPRFGAVVVADDACGSFPAAVAPRGPISAVGAGPIVVIGTTHDPVTPLRGAEAMAGALEDGHLVVVDARQHTGIGANACVDAVVRAYLVDLVLPDGTTRC